MSLRQHKYKLYCYFTRCELAHAPIRTRNFYFSDSIVRLLCCSLRAKYGKDVLANALHGASTEKDADEIIQTMFKDVDLDAVPGTTSSPLRHRCVTAAAAL